MKVISFKLLHKLNHHYISQCFLAYVLISGVLIFMGAVADHQVIGAVGVSAVASSTFLLMVLPDSKTARARNAVGGYIIGILCGLFGYLLLHRWGIFSHFFSHVILLAMWGGFVVGLSSLLMACFNMEHPPAAGLSLGLAYEHWQNHVVLVVMISILFISFLKYCLRNYLISLL